jgi:hypothetical protein
MLEHRNNLKQRVAQTQTAALLFSMHLAVDMNGLATELSIRRTSSPLFCVLHAVIVSQRLRFLLNAIQIPSGPEGDTWHFLPAYP